MILSIGWGTVTDVFRAKSRPNSAVILASYYSPYEFIFTSTEEYFLETIAAAFKGFKKSKHFREALIHTSAIIHEGEVIILKKEIVFEKLLGVFHLSSDIGTIGNLIVSNVRVVWYSGDSASNLSLPYLYIVKSFLLTFRQKLNFRNANMGK